MVERFDDLADEYRLADAYGLVYNFAWAEVFDWYLEIAKTTLEDPAGATRDALGVVLRDLLKLLHPAIPFLTEELWSYLVDEGLVAGASWPRVPRFEGPEVMADVQGLISEIRRFRAEQGLSPRTPLEVLLGDPAGRVEPWAEALVVDLAGVSLSRVDRPPAGGHTRVISGDLEAFIPLEGVIDLDAERARLDKTIAALSADLERAVAKLARPAFVERAPAEVVEKEEAKRAELTRALERLRTQREAL